MALVIHILLTIAEGAYESSQKLHLDADVYDPAMFALYRGRTRIPWGGIFYPVSVTRRLSRARRTGAPPPPIAHNIHTHSDEGIRSYQSMHWNDP